MGRSTSSSRTRNDNSRSQLNLGHYLYGHSSGRRRTGLVVFRSASRIANLTAIGDITASSYGSPGFISSNKWSYVFIIKVIDEFPGKSIMNRVCCWPGMNREQIPCFALSDRLSPGSTGKESRPSFRHRVCANDSRIFVLARMPRIGLGLRYGTRSELSRFCGIIAPRMI